MQRGKGVRGRGSRGVRPNYRIEADVERTIARMFFYRLGARNSGGEQG